ncbi:MAG: RNA 2',3'-cyclic phosphodiesterase [Patescibacteria group bacterium]|jgi:2'-5' RNA ligase
MFIAINPPESVKNDIGELIVKLKKYCWPVNWETPGKLHITLHFLGHIPESDIQIVRDVLCEVVKNTVQFEVKIDGFVAFPNFKFPNIIGLKISDSEALFRLQSAINQGIGETGIGLVEKHSFTGHITLGRLKPTYANFKALSGILCKSQFTVSSIELMESVLKPAGSEYMMSSSYQLRS